MFLGLHNPPYGVLQSYAPQLDQSCISMIKMFKYIISIYSFLLITLAYLFLNPILSNMYNQNNAHLCQRELAIET